MQEDLGKLTDLAQRGGPFFFAVLYAVVLTGWAAKKWAEARKDPTATKVDLRTHRLYFIFTASFGALAVMLACILWIQRTPLAQQKFTMEGTIALTSGQDIWSSQVFVRRDFGPEGLAGDFSAVFYVWQDHTFGPAQRFNLFFKKQEASKWEALTAVLQDGGEYRIRFDPAQNHNVIERTDGPQHVWWPHLDNVAYAAPAPFVRAAVGPVALTPSLREKLVRALQAERVYTGSEIEAVDTLGRLSAADRLSFLRSEGPNEPMVVTLLDLTRHQDDELAYKARSLEASTDVDGIFIGKLKDARTRPSYSAALSRLDPQRAVRIIDRVGDKSLRGAISGTPRMLTASASGDGDRFWISIGGSREREPSLSLNVIEVDLRCIGGVLRPPDFVRATSGPAVFWSYSKKSVLMAADALEKCHLKPRFTNR